MAANGTFFETEYTDAFLSTDPGNPAYFGNRSVVVHYPDLFRVNCGNFVPVDLKSGSVE